MEYFNIKYLSGAPKGRKVSIVKALRWGSERKKGDPKKRLLYRRCPGPERDLAVGAGELQIIKIEYKLTEENLIIGLPARREMLIEELDR